MAKETGEDILKAIQEKGGKGAGKAQEQVNEALGGNKTPPPGSDSSSNQSQQEKPKPGPDPKASSTNQRKTGFAAAKGELSDLTNKIKGKFTNAKNAAAGVVEFRIHQLYLSV